MEATHDMYTIADAERIGQVVQVAAGDAAFDFVVVSLSKAAGSAGNGVRCAVSVHRQLKVAAADEKLRNAPHRYLTAPI
jgi:hypothetical protein